MRTPDAWTRYWARGYLHSCPNAFSGNYGDAIASFWRMFFESVPSGSSVLDIGTGNGAIAVLARDTALALGRTLEIVGIDRARIDPAAAVCRSSNSSIDFAGIEFRGCVSIEQTGYAEASFDVITSQYAFEYTDLERTTSEMTRLLVPGGRLACILHHAGSVFAETSRYESAHIDFLVHEVSIFERAADLLLAIQHAVTADQIASLRVNARSEQCRLAFNEAAACIEQRIRTSAHVELMQLTLASIATIIRQRVALGPNAFRYLDTVKQELVAGKQRLDDLLTAALTEEDLRSLHARFSAQDMCLEALHTVRHTDGRVLGWALIERKGDRRLGTEE